MGNIGARCNMYLHRIILHVATARLLWAQGRIAMASRAKIGMGRTTLAGLRFLGCQMSVQQGTAWIDPVMVCTSVPATRKCDGEVLSGG